MSTTATIRSSTLVPSGGQSPDAAEETGAGVELTMDTIEDDRDVASLAAKVRQLAESDAFAEGVKEPVGASVSVEVGPMEGPPDEEALMMERM